MHQLAAATTGPLIENAPGLGELLLRWTAIILVAVITRGAARIVLRRALPNLLTPASGKRRLRALAARVMPGDWVPNPRREQRVETLTTVAMALLQVVIVIVAVIAMLVSAGVRVEPFLTSAGLITVALGFGAQNFLRDAISGIGMLLEDQFGVGDRIDTGTVIGVVERVGVRTTRVRGDNGAVWYLRNGDVTRVANFSQGPVTGTVSFTLPADTKPATVSEVTEAVERAAHRSITIVSDGLVARNSDSLTLQLTGTGPVDAVHDWQRLAVGAADEVISHNIDLVMEKPAAADLTPPAL